MKLVKIKLFLFSLPLFFAINQVGFAMDWSDDGGWADSYRYNTYSPYLQVGGAYFINSGSSNEGFGADFFIPLLQSPSQLLFTHLRAFDRTAKPFEGNAHLGYRILLDDHDALLGIYGSFDRNRSGLGNYFSQLTFGAEVWYQRLFVGGNYYQPIGDDSKETGFTTGNPDVKKDTGGMGNIWVTRNSKLEKAMGGFDAEVGYEFIDGLVLYAGGYYFNASDMSSISGPRARLTYDLSLDNGERMLGVFSKIGLEAGVQHDSPRGTVGYVGLNLRIGLSDQNSRLQGVSRHMVDLVRRDIDIVSQEKEGGNSGEKMALNENGDPIVIHYTDDGRAIVDVGGEYIFMGEFGDDGLNSVMANMLGAVGARFGNTITAYCPFTGKKLTYEMPIKTVVSEAALRDTKIYGAIGRLSKTHNSDAKKAIHDHLLAIDRKISSQVKKYKYTEKGKLSAHYKSALSKQDIIVNMKALSGCDRVGHCRKSLYSIATSYGK